MSLKTLKHFSRIDEILQTNEDLENWYLENNQDLVNEAVSNNGNMVDASEYLLNLVVIKKEQLEHGSH